CPVDAVVEFLRDHLFVVLLVVRVLTEAPCRAAEAGPGHRRVHKRRGANWRLLYCELDALGGDRAVAREVGRAATALRRHGRRREARAFFKRALRCETDEELAALVLE